VLDVSGAPHCEQTPLLVVLRLGTAAPQSILKAVDFNDAGERQRFVIGCQLAKSGE
jgi:hypothetical protein